MPPPPIGCGRRTSHICPRMKAFCTWPSSSTSTPGRWLAGLWQAICAAELVAAALEMAIRRRNPSAGLIHHSDRGAQYTALSFGKRLEQAWDRAVDE